MKEPCSTPFCPNPATEAVLLAREGRSVIEYMACRGCAEEMYKKLRPGASDFILWRRLPR